MTNESERIVTLHAAPGNMPEFLAESAQGLGQLYGQAAADEYLATAPGILRETLGHASVRAFAVENAEHEARAIVLAVLKPPIAHIVYLHVLERHFGRGIEGDLLHHALTHLRNEPIEGIISEYLATNRQEVDATFTSFGFTPERRSLMLAPLETAALAGDGPMVSAPFAQPDWEDAAGVLVDAYRGHPGRHLHLEVRDHTQALTFLRTVAHGGYGRFEPAFARIHCPAHGTKPDAMIIGSRVAPGVGFVLHVAVRRNAQGQGLGTRLVRDLAEAFRNAGFDRIGLGVTDDNPARRLYERLGFRTVRHLTAWYWWRQG